MAVLDRWLAGLWGTGDCTFVQARLGPLHLGCNREVAALLRWLLTQVSLYTLVLWMNTDLYISW